MNSVMRVIHWPCPCVCMSCRVIMNNMGVIVLTPESGNAMRRSIVIGVVALILLALLCRRHDDLLVVTVKTTFAHHETRARLMVNTWLGMLSSHVSLTSVSETTPCESTYRHGSSPTRPTISWRETPVSARLFALIYSNPPLL